MSTHAYIGIKPCGCCVAAVVDNPEHLADVASDVQEFIKAGLKVDRVTIGQARVLLGRRCGTHEAMAKQQELPMLADLR